MIKAEVTEGADSCDLQPDDLERGDSNRAKTIYQTAKPAAINWAVANEESRPLFQVLPQDGAEVADL